MPAKKKLTIEERLRKCEEGVRGADTDVELLRMAQVAVRRDFDGFRDIQSQVARLKAHLEAVATETTWLRLRCLPKEGALRICKHEGFRLYELREWRGSHWYPVLGYALTRTRWGMKRRVKREFGKAGLKRLVGE